MTKRSHDILIVLLCAVGLIALDACDGTYMDTMPGGYGEYRDAESLLDAEGTSSWALVDEDNFDSPINAHMNAREHVDTSRRSISSALRAKAKLKEERVRTLILVKADEDVGNLGEFLALKEALLAPDAPMKPERKPEHRIAKAEKKKDDVKTASADVVKKKTRLSVVLPQRKPDQALS